MNLFDGLQAGAQHIVTTTFGYTATWQPLAGGDLQTADVLLNKPTQKEAISDQDYQAMRPRMEYFEGDFPGLFESVQDKASETITINSIQYITVWGERKFDGKTIIIYLEPVT